MTDDLLLVGLIQLACANLFAIGLKATQQRNVARSHLPLMWATGFFLAYGETYVIDLVAEIGAGWKTATALWLGGGTGATIAVKVYDWRFGKILHEDEKKG